jgi:transcription initiation factor TFIIIB Brf1 subunit/transcription initiation factor TFIIB
LTFVLEDEELYSIIETEAKDSGRTIQEIIVEALRVWKVETEMDDEERREVEEALREWEKNGGMEARAFFDGLREEEARVNS